jgi:hypothetical protein
MTKKRLRQLASFFMIALSIPFIVLSTWQLIETTFGGKVSARAATPEEAVCTTKLKTLASALERASDAAAHETDEDHAHRAFAAAILPEWNDQASAETACNASPRGREAWAALLRLRRGLEGRSQKDARDVGPMRRVFETRLP